MGIVLVKPTPGVAVRPPAPGGDAAVARWLLERTADFHQKSYRLFRQMVEGTIEFAEWNRPVAAALRARLRCPDCRRGGLDPDGAGLHCGACGTAFPGEYGVPILYPTRPRADAAALDEALDRLCGADAGRRRVIRRLAHRLHGNERPAGSLRRATWRLTPLLRRAVG
jgi:hypothetical protein